MQIPMVPWGKAFAAGLGTALTRSQQLRAFKTWHSRLVQGMLTPAVPGDSVEINADFSRRVAVHAAQLHWVPSPMAGVERRMLDRIGDEVARAMSIVRYAPGSHFYPHTHSGGEESLVLEGVFQDEHGEFSAGSYVRNPPISRHPPGSTTGGILFVKLWWFDLADRKEVKVDTAAMTYQAAPAQPGVELIPLFCDDREDVRLERWAPGAAITLNVPGGAELLVLEGGFDEDVESFEPLSWFRLPSGGVLRAKAGSEGCRVWIKTGHLLTIHGADRPQCSWGDMKVLKTMIGLFARRSLLPGAESFKGQ